ncbi:bifunctional diaminohydroxyphosphoribosylaminopyrimidine deaminase/5-amino-6-(5-phosphoribosylamino)uracil reductase RibD [Sulfurospirillum diekertiae]|uniref:Bifunctional diaminohydroxyphosphoribosylaminopyrimidine deaminase/5-amino-6-(5-phosphoribosylamino)uracil reductase RibD n=2 Tax=Sulfurospirillum diekertiae TaxID=1854492 RepID=A0A6G9VSE4_9BACT|nr:bifunctional diaminohydroxyphosphoribosylaminopyrimidine deaminase/5-amino-6-(5-phosphoribosylamino)uracil reductase RibD [Sulfurospirillum diekertiae]QIR76278.1 bifunctional diaminohydroxyphosphoribosylaminopyrimidine deaminase/5-amino-6-(5-phosphoribosylamino)uracil reductase RibD [Sulfurospirillum diekertiae]QIR78909.1 bifunctional diaminohydroxyphosphoribosylaminopyrimidine deaminase/5-amino-6-(5-phosphoribosylamino)uracil reductase RibD [Sulfurospirillum diekertiae]
MVSAFDTTLMQKALDAAWAYQVLTFPNPAVGAVVSNGQGDVLGIGAHQKAGMPHAEVLALKAAYETLTEDRRIRTIEDATELHTFLKEHHNSLFHNLTLHVTLEPCHHFGRTPPCSGLIDALGIKRVVIGSFDESNTAKGGGAFLQEKGVNVTFGVLQEKCDLLLTPFTCKEKKRPFVFFKLAVSSNGVATGGIITSLDSRKMVHNLRNCCDLLVIGGNTVRTDRPILDARLCHGKAPNILIFSKQKSFDVTIPLFNVPHRSVMIEETLDKINDYSMVMIEGGQRMLDALSKEVKWYLIFESPRAKEGEAIILPRGLQKIFSQKVGEDTMSWYYKHAE